MNIFEEANNVLDNFIFNHLFSYHQLRNHDYGINKRNNVSQISKYTSHRILYAYDIVEKLNKFTKQTQIIINYINREEDLTYWNHTNSRFYKFKSSF